MEHPAQETLLRFLLGATTRQENREIVRHLLARCPACAAALRAMNRVPPLAAPPGPAAYDEAFDRIAKWLHEWTRGMQPAPGPPSPRGGALLGGFPFSRNATPRRGSG